MSISAQPPVLVVGAGPGLGLAIALRFGREGHSVALLSRSRERHDSYLARLRQEGITGIAVTADVRDPVRMRGALDEAAARLGPIGVVYYGPGAADPSARPAPVLKTRSGDLREAMGYHVEPALDLVEAVVPGMVERKNGALLFATGLGAVIALPGLGALGIVAAALRTYALTLNAALAASGVYAGALVIGGLIQGGDIHRLATAGVDQASGYPVLDPAVIADTAWTLSTRRDRPEATFNALTSAAGEDLGALSVMDHNGPDDR
jgi:NADP-dependent 3-hydroxy acid dehydrogenase YdfG